MQHPRAAGVNLTRFCRRRHAQALRYRAETGSRPGRRRDRMRIGLAIEGGGMRGCVSAGMAAALHHSGLINCFDTVLGSSAGALVGAMLMSGASASQTLEVFEYLSSGGKDFLVPARALSLIAHNQLPGRSAALSSAEAIQPIMDLDYLFQSVLQGSVPFDWQAFRARDAVQPLAVVASSLTAQRSRSLTSRKRNFHDLHSLFRCLRASCFLPGVAGLNPVRVDPGRAGPGRAFASGSASSRRARPNPVGGGRGEVYVDALVYEPLPYRSAVDQHDCTHVLVFRSWPDGRELPQAAPFRIFENILAPLCLRDHPATLRFMQEDGHSRVYAEDVLRLNAGAAGPDGPAGSGPCTYKGAHLLPLAVSDREPVPQLSLDRNVLLGGFVDGFARALEVLRPVVAAKPQGGVDPTRVGLADAGPSTVMMGRAEPGFSDPSPSCGGVDECERVLSELKARRSAAALRTVAGPAQAAAGSTGSGRADSFHLDGLLRMLRGAA